MSGKRKQRGNKADSTGPATPKNPFSSPLQRWAAGDFASDHPYTESSLKRFAATRISNRDHPQPGCEQSPGIRFRHGHNRESQ